MKIGKATVPRSAICTSNEDRIIVRGADLSEELIGQIDFGDYFFLLVTGRRADAAASAVLNATLVAIAEHGLVPSVQAARMTMAAAPDAMQGAVAAGLLGSGSVILGASETAGRLYLAVEKESQANGGDMRKAAFTVVSDLRARKQPIAGYGHPEHKQRDPRVGALFGVSTRAGGGQRYVEIAKVVEDVIPEVMGGKQLKLNVSGAIPAVLLGIGFPANALKGVPMLARTASLIAHLTEELDEPIGFALSFQAARDLEYTGLLPAGVTMDKSGS